MTEDCEYLHSKKVTYSIYRENVCALSTYLLLILCKYEKICIYIKAVLYAEYIHWLNSIPESFFFFYFRILVQVKNDQGELQYYNMFYWMEFLILLPEEFYRFEISQ